MVNGNARISNHLLGDNEIGHNRIDFVNTPILGDAKLFIDPVLIDINPSGFCKKSKIIIDDYFRHLYNEYYITNDKYEKQKLLMHAKEINDTHLGYAKRHGKGHTKDGLYEIFKGIEEYINLIKISEMFELALYTPNFAEDGMSDLLTNILYNELSKFTILQCKKYNIETTKCPKDRFYWDHQTHTWEKYCGESLVINGNIHLLIPKEIVQPRYHFTADDFLRSVIVENICKDRATYGKKGNKIRPPKGKVREELLNENGTVFNTVHKFAENDSRLSSQYRKIVHNKYRTAKLSDDGLDSLIYNKLIKITVNNN